ncbi:hypothetical protein P9209_21895 [Prescottella defluvii]|nr:hypothetical protein P9209_21895 [Prescottella defluvii]
MTRLATSAADARTPRVIDAVRTPFGSARGALSGIRADDLAALPIADLVGRHPELDPARIDDVVWGNANGAGEDNRNIARMALLLAGLPHTIPGVSVNRLCGSGAEAVLSATRRVAVGDADVVIAGGSESMSRAPYVLPPVDTAFPRALDLVPTTVGWRMTNPRFPAPWVESLAGRPNWWPNATASVASSRTSGPCGRTNSRPGVGRRCARRIRDCAGRSGT